VIGPPCLQDQKHGLLVDLPGRKWYCPHARHVGRAVYLTTELPEPWGDGAPVVRVSPGSTRAPRAGVVAPRRRRASVSLELGPAQAESAPAQLRLLEP
jgi:hypothetical protein